MKKKVNFKKIIGAGVALWLPMMAMASGLSDLEKFMETVQSGSAAFTQTLTVPPKGEIKPQPKISTGEFEFVRPGKFRFTYKKPYAQQIVGNGKTLWLYDPDLGQVTQKKQGEAMGSSPAALIIWSKSVKELEKNFTVIEESHQDKVGTEWVKAEPKDKNSGISYIKIGFLKGDLAELEILDSFGQKSLIQFHDFKPNVVLSKNAFEFSVPKGATVLKE